MMRGTKIGLIPASAIALALAGCAPREDLGSPIAAAAGDQCFNARNVRSFRPVGRDAVDVEINRDRAYRLSLGAGCFDVDWAQAVSLRSRSGSFICSPADAELVVPSSLGPGRCLVTGVRRLSDAEIDASRRR